MKDALGHEINVGDSVKFMDTNYKSLRDGIVRKIGEKKITIYTNCYYYGDETYRFPEQVINTTFIKNLEKSCEILASMKFPDPTDSNDTKNVEM